MRALDCRCFLLAGTLAAVLAFPCAAQRNDHPRPNPAANPNPAAASEKPPCADESRAGYYNGTYHSYAPPVIRNGYYGYNTPESLCEDRSEKALHRQGDPKSPQNRVEYGGGG